jgi:hypothetical protein
MNPGIQMLELAIGIKDSLMAAGFTSLESLLRSNPTEVATILGIEFYVGKIIIDAARRAAGKGDDDGKGDSVAAIPAD